MPRQDLPPVSCILMGSEAEMIRFELRLTIPQFEVVHLATIARKEWETVGHSWLLVIGDYRLGFKISSTGEYANLRVFIGYNLPSSPGCDCWDTFLPQLTPDGAFGRWSTARAPILMEVLSGRKSAQGRLHLFGD
jgi:hypothetical protein